jgi:hypothetical protein
MRKHKINMIQVFLLHSLECQVHLLDNFLHLLAAVEACLLCLRSPGPMVWAFLLTVFLSLLLLVASRSHLQVPLELLALPVLRSPACPACLRLVKASLPVAFHHLVLLLLAQDLLDTRSDKFLLSG